jgi:broad specificity phosphatase PhoE
VPETTLIFETHATSLDNEAGLASGWFDVDLSPLGVRQAEELGRRYAAEAVDTCFCSDLWRSWHTAEIAFGERVPIVRDLRLREIDYGNLTRQPVAVVDARRGECLTRPFPGGESYEQVVDRVLAFLEEAAPIVEGGLMLLIGHRATSYALEHLLNGRPLADVVGAPWRWQPGWRYRLLRP